MKYELKELLGVSDVARILGWENKKVSAYLYNPKVKHFPQPIGEIGGRPVWFINDVMAFRKTL